MITQTQASSQSQPTVETLNDLIIDSIQDIKGKSIVRLDLRHLTERPADFFIICEGESNTQIRSIANNIGRRMEDTFGIRPYHTEGSANLTWVLVDFSDTIIHIFNQETRFFYDLESLWGDAKVTRYEDMN